MSHPATIGLLLSVSILLSACTTSTPVSKMQILSDPAHDGRNLPFSEAIRAGDFIFLSGQIAAKPGTLDLVPGGIQAETRQVMDNIQDVLNRHRSSMDDIVKCTVFIEDMQDWPAMNEVYVTYFPNHKPARSAVGADGIALGGGVEIECIAYQPQ